MYDTGNACVMFTVAHLLIKLRLETEILMRFGPSQFDGKHENRNISPICFSLMSFV